jgi:dynein heavy chain 2
VLVYGCAFLTLQARWDKLDLMLESHALMIKEQVEVMKTGVQARIDSFNQVCRLFH